MQHVHKDTNLLLYPNIQLVKGDRRLRPTPMLHPETNEPFTGISCDAFTLDSGKSTIHYITYENGLRNGREIVTNCSGFIRLQAYWKNNRLNGPRFMRYNSGLYREKSVWISHDLKSPSRLIEISIWKENGQRCPHSGVDEQGNGQKLFYHGDGRVSMIDFFTNHLHSGTLFFEEDGSFNEGWVGNYPRLLYQLELLD